jgi:hypothetical protein
VWVGWMTRARPLRTPQGRYVGSESPSPHTVTSRIRTATGVSDAFSATAKIVGLASGCLCPARPELAWRDFAPAGFAEGRPV